jgi:hypothetical protein
LFDAGVLLAAAGRTALAEQVLRRAFHHRNDHTHKLHTEIAYPGPSDHHETQLVDDVRAGLRRFDASVAVRAATPIPAHLSLIVSDEDVWFWQR